MNSPLKLPPSSASKDSTGGAVGGRKSSISHGGSFNVSSPTSTRPGVRRRETAESIGNPSSPSTNTPTSSRYFRDEPAATVPPPSLLRRKTDVREASANSKSDDKEKGKDSSGPELASPFGSLKRSTTNPLGASLTGPASPWSASSHNAAFSPMGAFGSFSLSSSTTQPATTEKRPGFSSARSESRFKGLLSKDNPEEVGPSVKEKSNQRSLEKLAEDEDGRRSASPWGEPVKTRAGRSETNPFSEELQTGSAALGGSQDAESPTRSVDQLGFSTFGMTSGLPGFHDLIQGRESGNDAPSHLHGLEPTSPTNTNPYQSPRGEKADVDDVDTDGSDVQRTHLPGLSGLREESSAGPFGPLRKGGSGLDHPASDRSQTSSTGPGRNFPALGGLGGVSGLGGSGTWPSGAPIGTPTRDRSGFAGFGDPIFGSMAELQPPSLAALGGGGFFGSHGSLNAGSIGRASKMGSLFSTTLQEQMQTEPGRQDLPPTEGAGRQSAERPTAADASASLSSALPPSNSVGNVITPLTSSADIHQTGPSQPVSTPSSNSMPTAQQRTMVMPDRMRWIYRDPQGNIQGPWSGLEMHDWFKAGFFTAELQVKKVEDIEFEPLAQLVRRIGNSREPFLVPQIGIPHGPDPAPVWTAGTQPGTAQPPFANSFPTFGTTLTAEQQNALERRKQEEQYLMARQKEHLAQHQALMKQMQIQGAPHGIHPHPLNHHSSAHSLHSQPSFGSITTPSGGYQPSPIQGPLQGPIQPPQALPGYFDASIRPNPLSNLGPQLLGSDLMGAPDELSGLMERLNVNRPGAFSFGSQAAVVTRQHEGNIHTQQVAAMLQDRARLQQEQEQYDSVHPEGMFDQHARDERLHQFHTLRSQEEDSALRSGEGLPPHSTTLTQNDGTQKEGVTLVSHQQDPESVSAPNIEPLSLSQQVQKAASAQRQQQRDQAHAEAAWAKAENGMPQPFPPPPSASPLPAPAAQRNRQNVADALAATSRSQNQTPIETPVTSVAPWAKDTSEAPKGPSLKEIQEAEARSAALREEVAAATRRAQLLAEQERLSQVQTAAAPALPSTANWASSGSPVTQGSSTSASVWAKPVAGKAPVALGKKTLAQIQKEEESRKQRLAAANAQPANVPPTSATGKRYADLAGKAPMAQPITSSGAWTTVGASGKAKPPSATPAVPRSTSGTIPVIQAAKARPVVPTRTVTVGATPVTNPNKATEELTKWAKATLGRGLNSTINGKFI